MAKHKKQNNTSLFTYEQLFTIRHAVGKYISELERLHWRVVPFVDFTPDSKQTKIFTNIQAEVKRINDALAALSALYTAQFKR